MLSWRQSRYFIFKGKLGTDGWEGWGYRGKKRNIDQWNRVRTPEIYSHIFGHVIFDKGTKTIQHFSTSGTRKLDTQMQKNEVEPLPNTTCKS